MSTQGRHSRLDKSSPLAEGSLHAEFAEHRDWHDHETRAMASLNSTGSPLAAAAAAAQGSEPAQISVGQRMLSATGGSILTSLLVTPLDVVRIRLQSQASHIHNASKFTAHTTDAFRELPADLGVTACCREVFWIGNNPEICLVGNGPVARAIDCAVEDTQQRRINSTFDGIRKIARNEGVLTLWRGLVPTLVMSVPGNVIYLAGYEWLRVDPHSPLPRYIPDGYVPLVAGSIARVAAASAISPIEMFRTRLQATPGTGTGHFRATLEGLHQMTQARGYSSLWRGLSLTMWRDVPFSGLYWWGYEAVRDIITDLRERNKHKNNLQDGLRSRRGSQSSQSTATTFMDSFIAGSVSGAVAALVTTPFDVGKTRQQVFRHGADEVVGSTAGRIGSTTVVHPELLSMPRFLLHIFKHEGLGGLFKGWVARCLKVAPACAIMISSYELGKKMAQGVNTRRHSDGDNL
ncbi:mitochondrial carrier protein, putative [Talaromyces stipitatus ATCC 10500]|uniref:Mitochondrial carrier protein, putative n=1 Tax=Talaromyces stipitatus (strain ATCC 10500 / CBS 375.48 / QM 6759 / NRRL 1006) TaxID=441959 RepID=B8LYX7_TALSN|nr:mitochondrial carrier protein, putative [Talaromyces stipitatus ATCC 10500]EED23484.1 mitochondrial carrier protein, putative [Talaromyces stipitatus ATCC 10500]